MTRVSCNCALGPEMPPRATARSVTPIMVTWMTRTADGVVVAVPSPVKYASWKPSAVIGPRMGWSRIAAAQGQHAQPLTPA